MKNNIKKLLREASEKKSPQRDRVYNILNKDIFNHAAIIRDLWGNSDGKNRSLFRKKLERESKSGGEAYDFTDSEINKISSILIDASSQIKKGLHSKSGDETKYDKIYGILEKDIFNYAAISRAIWGTSDDSKRSEFLKKVKRKTIKGVKYQFDDDELMKIANELLNTSADIKKNLGQKNDNLS